MNISYVTNAIKVGDFEINKKFLKPKEYKKKQKEILFQTNLINLRFTLDKDILSKKICHVYFFCCNDKIFKIGGSNSSIEDNLENFYINQAISGGFSNSRFLCHIKIYTYLKKGYKLSAHAITYDDVKANIKELNKTGSHIVGLDSRSIEGILKDIYFKKEKKYPEWNYQENKKEYSSDVKMYNLMTNYKTLRDKKKSKALLNNHLLISHFRRCKNYNLV